MNAPPPQLFSGKRVFSASTSAVDRCFFAAVPKAAFLEALSADPLLSGFMPHYFARLIEAAGAINSYRLLTTKYETVLLYLYAQRRDRKLPAMLPITRGALAKLLGVSLRTLFRCTDRLQAEGCVCIRRGRLVITEACRKNLHLAAQDIYRRIDSGSRRRDKEIIQPICQSSGRLWPEMRLNARAVPFAWPLQFSEHCKKMIENANICSIMNL